MIKTSAVAVVLLACGLTACTKQPEPAVSPDTASPGATAPDAQRTPPRSGLNSDPNNPNGAPGTNFGPNIVR